MSFTGGPFGFYSFQVAPTLTTGPRSSLSTSRKLDAQTRRYVVSDDGGFDAMDDTAQRVLITFLQNSEKGAFIDDREFRAEESRLRDALQALTVGTKQAIRIVSLSVKSTQAGVGTRELVYENLITGTRQTVAARTT